MSGRRWAIGLVLVLAGSVCGGAIAWKCSDPSAFPAFDGRTTEGLTRAAPDGAHYFGMTWSGHGARRVVPESAVPVVRENTAKADIEVLGCEVAPPPDGSLLGVASQAQVEEFCHVVPTSGIELNLPDDDPKTQLVVKVTPRRAGRVLVDGIKLNYAQGWQQGSQHIGIRVDFRVGR